MDATPCDEGCEGSKVKPASFKSQDYDKVTGNVCPGKSLWYTCAFTEPPFMGCCESNPCNQDGCPASDLRAASLSPDEEESAAYSPIPDPSSMGSSSSSQPTSPSSPAASSVARLTLNSQPTATVTSLPAASSSSTNTTTPTTSSSTPPGAIAGAVIGGVALLSLIAFLVLFFLRRRRRNSQKDSASELPTKETPASSYQDSSSFPTPMYTSSNLSTPGHPPFHELETPPKDPWHTPKGRAYEMESPNLNKEKKVGEIRGAGGAEGLGIWKGDSIGTGRYELGTGTFGSEVQRGELEGQQGVGGRF
ncbi:MAG: hypothetical protein LQ351_003854 [Letrouitia transgressa]|nr:MAG: hypothetical protein LQ351_003854 [Letrouitia transgressa]